MKPDAIDTQSESRTPVPWAQRVLALGYYLGGAPLAWLRPAGARTPFLAHHLRQALAVFALLPLTALVFFIAVAIISATMIFWRDLYEGVAVERNLINFSRRTFLCWGVLALFSAAHAPWGSMAPVPIIHRIARRRRLLHLAAGCILASYTLIALAGAFTLHAGTLMRHDPAPGKVYFLYEDMDQFPRALFALGFYRLARASDAAYGPGEAVMLDLDRGAIERALREGSFIFIGSHGMTRGLLVDGGWFTPEDARRTGLNRDLRYVYLTGCDQPQAWIDAFAPAEVVTFGRLTAVVEHIWWMWVTGPAKLRAVATQAEVGGNTL